MLRLIIIVLIFVLAICLGLMMQSDPGYVLIAYKQWTIETSLWFAILLELILFFLFYYIAKFFYILIRSHGHLTRWYREKQLVKAHTVTGAGLLALAEADWDEAEKLLVRGIKSSSIPVVNYLNAARAAQAQHKIEERDEYLDKASHMAKKNELIAVVLTRAQLYLTNKELHRAVSLLEGFRETNSKHPYALQLLMEGYIASEDWKQLSELLPALKRRKVLTKQEIIELQAMIATKSY